MLDSDLSVTTSHDVTSLSLLHLEMPILGIYVFIVVKLTILYHLLSLTAAGHVV